MNDSRKAICAAIGSFYSLTNDIVAKDQCVGSRRQGRSGTHDWWNRVHIDGIGVISGSPAAGGGILGELQFLCTGAILGEVVDPVIASAGTVKVCWDGENTAAAGSDGLACTGQVTLLETVVSVDGGFDG